MENEINVFFSPRFIGERFNNHSLPSELLADFKIFNDLLIEIAKKIYLQKNPKAKKTPKNFTDGISLYLVNIEKGSAVAEFTLTQKQNSLFPFENNPDYQYFDEAKNVIFSIISNENTSHNFVNENNYTSFEKLGKNLLEDESIDFGYNYQNKKESNIVLNKESRKTLLLKINPKKEYSEEIKLFALVSAIDLEKSYFNIETDFGKIQCTLNKSITDAVLKAVNEFKNNRYVLIKGLALFNQNDKIIRIKEIESFELVENLDISLRIYQLLKLEKGWLYGEGFAYDKNQLETFGNKFDQHYDNNLPLPALFPNPNGNIQLEWQNNSKNLVIEINLSSLDANFNYFDDDKDWEELKNLNSIESWEFVNQTVSKMF